MDKPLPAQHKHIFLDQLFDRVERDKSDSDFMYFWSLLLTGEAMVKLVALAMLAGMADDTEHTKYSLKYKLVRADGLGEWHNAISDVVKGKASRLLCTDAKEIRNEITLKVGPGEWQYEATSALKSVLNEIGVESNELPLKPSLLHWFGLFATLRNKTRGHGATRSDAASLVSEELRSSLEQIRRNFSLFRRPWAQINRQLSGKYHVTQIAGDCHAFDSARNSSTSLENGIYIYWDSASKVDLIHSHRDLRDFFLANGSFSASGYELLSYCSDDKERGDSSHFLNPPSTASSETEGKSELLIRGSCFSNAPELAPGYIDRKELEAQLLDLLTDTRWPIITLLGRGGIGKTSLALRVLERLYEGNRFDAIVWLSARDVDLQLTGPKPVKPTVLTPQDMSKYYARLTLSEATYRAKGFDAVKHFEAELRECSLGPTLFIFDNFETSQSPIELYKWIAAHIGVKASGDKHGNKILITTRLRDFKGDYPVEVPGMTTEEARQLIDQTAHYLQIQTLIDSKFIESLIVKSAGHPYVIKMLLGEVARNPSSKKRDVPQLVAGSDDVLDALFQRTYKSLSPCAQRAFLTLSSWSSPVARVAIEAVLYNSIQEPQEVERAIESLLQYSIAESLSAPLGGHDLIRLPIVATIFGKKKLNVSPYRAKIIADSRILQRFGAVREDDPSLGLERLIANYIRSLAKDPRDREACLSIAETICRRFNLGWYHLANWYLDHAESSDVPSDREKYLNQAKSGVEQFLENSAGEDPTKIAEGWDLLGTISYKLGDSLGEVHADIEKANVVDVPYWEISRTANELNAFLREYGTEIDRENKVMLAERILSVMYERRAEASAGDYSRIAWLCIHLKRIEQAKSSVLSGLELDPANPHLTALEKRLKIR